MSKSFLLSLCLTVLAACARESLVQPAAEEPTPAQPTPVADIATPTPALPTPVPAPTPATTPVAEIAAPATPPTPATTPEPAFAPPTEVYSGTHKLGVNRVTDMARIGSATFSRRDGALYLKGRVERGKHWLALEGTVETAGPNKFHLTGTLTGVPDMAWANQAPRERHTEGRFTFEVKKGRPYWRLYAVNGRNCVCDDRCGNDFCYVDIEHQPTP